MQEGQPFQQMVLEKLDIGKRNEPWSKYHTLYKKLNETFVGINIKCKAITLSGKKKTRINLQAKSSYIWQKEKKKIMTHERKQW